MHTFEKLVFIHSDLGVGAYPSGEVRQTPDKLPLCHRAKPSEIYILNSCMHFT